MKLRHNKKRNTALIFETLSRELTKAIVNKDSENKNKIISIIKEHFKKGTTLATELELYKGILQSRNMDSLTAEKVIFESKKQYDDLDKEKIFNEQSNLIKKINKELSTEVFSNFVPNYKNLATLYQIFNSELAPKNKVLLENEIVGYMSDKQTIREEKKQVLNKYITSFVDNGIELKLFLNEEIGRLKEVIGESLATRSAKDDYPAL